MVRVREEHEIVEALVTFHKLMQGLGDCPVTPVYSRFLGIYQALTWVLGGIPLSYLFEGVPGIDKENEAKK